MAATTTSTHGPAGPPGGGRQDHEAMFAAGTHAVEGMGGPTTQAASGGLDVAGREVHPVPSETVVGPPEMIPGARDRTTAMHREPGAIGGRFNGEDIPPTPEEELLGPRTTRDRALEGGGHHAITSRG